jgi:hypothetical protein
MYPILCEGGEKILSRSREARIQYYFERKVVHNLKLIYGRELTAEVSRMIAKHTRKMDGLAACWLRR